MVETTPASASVAANSAVDSSSRKALPKARALQTRPAKRHETLPPSDALIHAVPGAAIWPAQERATATVWFDHTDLAHYFAANRTPTGIQRVEIEVYRATRHRDQAGTKAQACCFDLSRRCWVQLPTDAFDGLCGVGEGGTDRPDQLDDATWELRVVTLQFAIEAAAPVAFQRHDVLVTVGASWWIPDYLQFVRHLQHERGVLYAPFIHDVIPLLVPEHCAAGLVAEFRDWFTTAMHAADLTFANSACTARDIAKMAEAMGLPVPAPHVVRLDAHAGVQAAAGFADRRRAAVTHARLGVNRPFALFVATIEARKDHMFVFRCWQQLIEEHGADAVPDLLCVGKFGWLVEFTRNWLQVNPALADKVRLLGTVSDEELSGLYATAQFCVYNSHYEGWGLPVTESLCHGRVPLVPRHSSLPEAGGVFAAYFEPGSAESFKEQAIRLLDPASRAEGERRIHRSFRPRPWSAVLEQIVSIAARAPLRQRPPGSGIKVETGFIYSLGRRQAGVPLPRSKEGQILLPGSLTRFGLGWWLPEEWGCWSRLATAQLLFSVTPEATRHRTFVYIVLRGGPSALTLTLHAGRYNPAPTALTAHGRHLVKLPLDQIVGGAGDVMIGFGATPYSLADYTEGGDQRMVGFGLQAVAVVSANDCELRQDILELVMLDN